MSHSVTRRAATTFTATLIGASVLVSPLVPAALADATIATTTTMSLPDLNPKPVGRTVELVSLVSPNNAGQSGTMTLYDDDGVTRTQLDSKPVTLDPIVVAVGAHFTIAANMPAGTYHLLVAYSGDSTFLPSESEKVTFVVGPRPTDTNPTLASTHDGSGATAQKGDAVSVTANVTDIGSYTPNPIPLVGTVTIEVDNVEVGTTTPNGQLELSTSSWALGSHTIKATYAADGVDHTGSVGSKSITILADVVEATGVGVSAATFYPYHDGYKDTVAIRGSRGEPISVAIRIYGPTGAQVRTFSVASGTGAYSVAWNGRTASGAALAAGKYKVVQTLTDGAHTAKAVTAYTTISSKRLVTFTKTLTKDYAHRSAQGTHSVAWDFTLPSATVYKKLVFSVYGKSSPSGGFGPHDFSTCSRSVFDLSCGYPSASIGSGLAWRSMTGNVGFNRTGSFTRLYAVAQIRTNLKQGRVTVTYAILK